MHDPWTSDGVKTNCRDTDAGWAKEKDRKQINVMTPHTLSFTFTFTCIKTGLKSLLSLKFCHSITAYKMWFYELYMIQTFKLNLRNWFWWMRILWRSWCCWMSNLWKSNDFSYMSPQDGGTISNTNLGL